MAARKKKTLKQINAPFARYIKQSKTRLKFERLTREEAALVGKTYSAKNRKIAGTKVTKRTKVFTDRQVAEYQAGVSRELVTKKYARFESITGLTEKDRRMLRRRDRGEKIKKGEWGPLWKRYSYKELVEALGS